MVVQALDGLRARRQMRSWNVLVGLCPVHIFSFHTMQFLSNIFVDTFSFEKGRQISFNQIMSTWWARSHNLKVKVLFSVDFGAIVVALKK